MVVVPDPTLSWLYNSLTTEYRHVNRTYSDIARTLSQYPTLSPRTDIHTFENGVSALLVLLYGTLATSFRGSTYRFPVSIWVPHMYPQEPPLVYVTPTADMAVRPGQHVSVDGRIYHPYLAQWTNHWDKSNIADFLSLLTNIFAKEPPLVLKQTSINPRKGSFEDRAATSPSPHQSTPSTGPQLIPQAGSSYRPQFVVPRPPPKPPEAFGSGISSPAITATSTRFAASSTPPRPPKSDGSTNPEKIVYSNARPVFSGDILSRPRPTVPQHNTRIQPLGEPLPQQSAESWNHHHHERVESSASNPFQIRSNPPSQRSQGVIPITRQSPKYSLPSLQYPPQRTMQYGQHQPLLSPQQRPTTMPQTAPKMQEPMVDLMSAPLDSYLPSQTSSEPSIAAPPIPPNPEKDALLHAISIALRNELEQTISQNNAALPALLSQNLALQQAYQRMQSEMSQLQQLDAMLNSNEKILHDAMHEADRVMESVVQREVPAVDDVLVAPTVVGEQLYGLVAEEKSILDTLFVLQRALDKGQINGNIFIKQTRSLAREQFLKKALIKKIARGMGLAMDDE